MKPYYEDDLVQLHHGDCREVTEWLAADVLVTDPPYGISRDARNGDNRGPRSRRGRVYHAIHGDKDASLRDAALETWGRRPAVVFGTWRIARPGVGLPRALLVWHKDGAFSGLSGGPFFTNHEEIYILGDGWPSEGKPLRSVLTTTEHRSQATRDIGHPTPKPVALMELLIDKCPPGTVADPFAGSGSTLVAAKLLGRKAIGVEIEERYCEIAASRLTQDALPFGEAP